jgi:CRP-like cAMP-binding protein
MPVTARLSQKFYERLGEDLAQELVDWFNAVDATYRADLRKLNELNFQRFDAKVEQRFAQFDAKIERRFAQADAKLETSVAALREEFRTGLSDRHVSLLKWMFGFWIATLAPLAGLILTLRLL